MRSASTVFVAPIVEGHGEIEAFPALLHRIAEACHARLALRVNQPIRVKASSFTRDDAYMRKHVALAAAKAAQAGGSVLILLDCEDDCPADLGPQLLAKAQAVRLDVPCTVVLAYREYESWFVTAAASLRGETGLPNDLMPPTQPEATRDAKGWLGRHMPVPYDPVVHQLTFSRAIDLVQARDSQSFDRLYRKTAALLDGKP